MDHALGAPQREQRRAELPALRAVAAIVLEVDPGGGAVVLADAVRRAGQGHARWYSASARGSNGARPALRRPITSRT